MIVGLLLHWLPDLRDAVVNAGQDRQYVRAEDQNDAPIPLLEDTHYKVLASESHLPVTN